MLVDNLIVEDNGRAITTSTETTLVLQNVDIHVTDVDKLAVTPAPGGDTFLTYFELVDYQWRMSDGQVRLPFPFVIANKHSIASLVHTINDVSAQYQHLNNKLNKSYESNRNLRDRINELEKVIGVREFLDDEPMDWQVNDISPKIREQLEAMGINDW